ncbi:MAG TPA: ABC transporter ATP-binding protein [Candidatus Sulfotelmatobacter sp.]|nr:ABC transporter ATP-binding protein [Candidatus Sulfotelmatobacter sp.]
MIDQGPILEVRELVKHYGGVRAVDGVSFSAARGTVTGLIGPNGAGKSTALNVIGGFIPPDGGRVIFDGADVTGWPMHRLARRGLVRTFQLARVFGNLTTIENLLVAAPGQRGETAFGILGGRRYWREQERELLAQAREMLRAFGMEAKADDYARNLSGGQKRAVETMRALMMHPKLLLLDEPMAGLSPSLSHQLEDLFIKLTSEGMSLLLVEHELDTVDRLCSKVVVMAQGKVLSEGRMTELRTRKEVQDAYVIG